MIYVALYILSTQLDGIKFALKNVYNIWAVHRMTRGTRLLYVKLQSGQIQPYRSFLPFFPLVAMAQFPDYYKLLNIPKTATSDDIRQAYKRESLKCPSLPPVLQPHTHDGSFTGHIQID